MATEFLAVVCFSYLELSGTRYPSANVNLSANIPETIARSWAEDSQQPPSSTLGYWKYSMKHCDKAKQLACVAIGNSQERWESLKNGKPEGNRRACINRAVTRWAATRESPVLM